MSEKIEPSPVCPDCAVAVAEVHEDGCDVERCLTCYGQRLACDEPSAERQQWTGYWPGELEAASLGMDLNQWTRYAMSLAGAGQQAALTALSAEALRKAEARWQ